MEWDTFEGIYAVVDTDKRLESLVELQLEKARLVERLGALEAQTAELISEVHEEASAKMKESDVLRATEVCPEERKILKMTIEGHLSTMLASRV